MWKKGQEKMVDADSLQEKPESLLNSRSLVPTGLSSIPPAH